MGRIKDWMLEMEELTYNGLDSGIRSEDEILDYVRNQMSNGFIDEGYILKVSKSYFELLGINSKKNADKVDGYDRDDLGESPDY